MPGIRERKRGITSAEPTYAYIFYLLWIKSVSSGLETDDPSVDKRTDIPTPSD